MFLIRVCSMGDLFRQLTFSADIETIVEQAQFTRPKGFIEKLAFGRFSD